MIEGQIEYTYPSPRRSSLHRPTIQKPQLSLQSPVDGGSGAGAATLKAHPEKPFSWCRTVVTGKCPKRLMAAKARERDISHGSTVGLISERS